MAKFKVGDRVKVVDERGGGKRGDIGVIKSITPDGYCEIDGLSLGAVGLYEHRLELVPVAAATGTFKVGDRVRFTDKCHRGWWFGPHTENKEGVIAGSTSGSLYKWDVSVGGGEGGVDDEHIELIEDNWDYDPRTASAATKPEPLRIQAGKFYKTRDGRKVGPMRCDRGIQGYKWDGRGTGQFYNDLGAADDGEKYDLIAEWSAGRECAAAQVDNQRDEYGPVGGAGKASNDNGKPKFKVGDRVVFNTGKGSEFDGKTGVLKRDWLRNRPDYFEFHSDDGSWTAAHINNFNRPSTPAIVALIENGQPKPSDRPHVHVNRAAAEKEAARLADKHRGKEFGVYELVSTASKEPEYAHEWQRLAAGGERIPAIIAYRDAGGRRQTFFPATSWHPAGYEDRHVIGLKEAKDAVEHWIEALAA